MWLFECIECFDISDKCYENKDLSIPFKETDPLGGNDLYSSSKACSEILTHSYRTSFFDPKKIAKNFVSIATARSGNVIGGGDWSNNRIIPDLIRGIQHQKMVIIRNPVSERPWQFVLDPLNGYIQLAEKLWYDGKKYNESWNFGPISNKTKPVSYLISKFTDEWDELEIKIEKNSIKESKYLKLNLDQTIEWTIEWYKSFFEGKNMDIGSQNQINKFSKLNYGDDIL